MNNLAAIANDIITYKGLCSLEQRTYGKEIEEKLIENYAYSKAEKLINGKYSKEYEDFIGEISWLNLELADRLSRLEKKLLTYKRIERLRKVMKSILLELAIQYYKNNFNNMMKN